MPRALIHQLLPHPTPQAVWDRVAATLAEQCQARKALREWMKPDVKAEFINGEIIMHSPAKRRRNQATRFIASLLDVYVSRNGLGEIAVEKALVELARSDVRRQPDAIYGPEAGAGPGG